MKYTCMTKVLIAPRRNLTDPNSQKHNRKKWNICHKMEYNF